MKPTFLGFLLLGFVVLVGMSSRPYIRDNRMLGRVRDEYSSVRHPTSSLALASFSQLGIAAGGNGNHCDYLVGEIRESDDSPDQIKAHYSAISFPMLDPQNSQWATGEPIPISVEFPGSPDDSGVLRWNIHDALTKARPRQRKKTLYVVYLLDGGYEPNGDWRCH